MDKAAKEMKRNHQDKERWTQHLRLRTYKIACSYCQGWCVKFGRFESICAFYLRHEKKMTYNLKTTYTITTQVFALRSSRIFKSVFFLATLHFEPGKNFVDAKTRQSDFGWVRWWRFIITASAVSSYGHTSFISQDGFWTNNALVNNVFLLRSV